MIDNKLKRAEIRLLKNRLMIKLVVSRLLSILIFTNADERKWINYEIEKSLNDGKRLLSICIHYLKDRNGNQFKKGRKPFDDFFLVARPLSKIVKTYYSHNTYSKKFISIS